ISRFGDTNSLRPKAFCCFIQQASGYVRRSRDDFVHRQMAAYVFPHNVERLSELTDQLARSA
ncbi:MAG: hypothetical protein ACOCYG_04990, partial [Spirochaetota bacterium]